MNQSELLDSICALINIAVVSNDYLLSKKIEQILSYQRDLQRDLFYLIKPIIHPFPLPQHYLKLRGRENGYAVLG